MATTTTRPSKVATVIIPVADQDAALAFYTEKLGFQLRVEVPFGEGSPLRWIEVGLSDNEDTTTIALAPPPEDYVIQTRETGISLYCQDVDGYHAALKAAGVDVDDAVQRMGGPVPPMFWFRDHAGNSLMCVGDSDM
ncbi:MAG TPA: VOC family protein [Mycobacteriales bacterium]|nr:VOC family protein [Mycobacteriales bacterium]